MDDHTFFLVRQADEQIRRTALMIEQHRLHIMACIRPAGDVRRSKLKSLMSDYNRLLNYRQLSRLSHLTP